MKIRTICKKISTEGQQAFDNEVNAALAEGWHLVKREVLPGYDLSTCYFAPSYYAELVLPDPAPELADPLEAVRAIRAMCLNTSLTDCQYGACPLDAWCQQLAKGGDPTDWSLPEEEATP